MGISKTIAKNTLFKFIASASELLINMVIGIVLARGLGPEQYGLYTLLIWFLYFACLVVNFGLGDMMTRYIAEAQGRQRMDDTRGLIRLGLSWRVLVTMLAVMIILIFSRFWANLFGDPENQIYFIAVAFMLLPNVLNLVLIRIFAGFQRYEYGAYVILGTNPLRLVLVILLMVIGLGLMEVLILSAVIWVLGAFIGVFLLRHLIPLKSLFSPSPLSTVIQKRAVRYALAMAGIEAINYFVYQQGSVFFVGLYCPVEQVGFYTLASKLPLAAMGLIPSVFGAVLLPAIAEQFGKGDMEKLRKIYTTSARYITMLALPLAVGGIALARPTIHVLYGADYGPTILLMQILFIPIALGSINRAASSVIFGVNEPAFILKVGTFLALLNIGLSWWLVQVYGTLGVAIASSIPRVLALPFYVYFVFRRIGVTWPVRDTVMIALASLIMGAVLFGLQAKLGAGIISLVLGIPLGILLYTVALLALRAVHKQDLTTLEVIRGSLPSALKKKYTAAISLAIRFVRAKFTVE
jgi:O-antigen/teichoic acid export membrane protein